MAVCVAFGNSLAQIHSAARLRTLVPVISAGNSGRLFKNLRISLTVINIQIFGLQKKGPNSHFFMVLQLKKPFIPLVLIIHHIIPTLLHTFG